MKRLNNRGFAISTLLYGLMIMSLMIVFALFSNLATNRKNTSTFVDKIEDELNRFSLSDTSGDYEGGEVDNNGREYIAESDGWYKIELYGAGGGGTNGGRGAYVSGLIYLQTHDRLYFYVGEKGNTNASFNGGGSGSFSGGGSTDVRLISGAYNDATSLNSRIMVAAGGGGGTSSMKGGPGGTLLTTPSNPAGGTAGTFGIGGNGVNGGGGGGGYYGGTGGKNGAAGGGSSFIVNYAGVSMKDASLGNLTKEFLYHRGDYNEDGTEKLEKYKPIIYNGMMIPGVNDGVGKFQIIKVSNNDINNPPRKSSNAQLNNIRYVQDCISSTDGSKVEWAEIQVVVNGVNVAYNKGNPSGITNGITSDSSAYVNNSGKCVTIDLKAIYDNLDEIAVWHKASKSYKNHTIKVSSDNRTWREIKGLSTDSNEGRVSPVETENGIHYNLFNLAANEIIEGDYYIFSAESDNLALTPYSEDGVIYAKMNYFMGGKDTEQVWSLVKNIETGTYRIINRANNLALDIKEGNVEEDFYIDLVDNNLVNKLQDWNISPLNDGYYTIYQKNGDSIIRMGYDNTVSLAKTQLVTQKLNQRWKFVLANY